ncbi:MAG: GntP family permease [Bdellovibrionota bacterium]
MGSLGILLSLCLLMAMAYRGFSVIFFAPVFAILAAWFSGFSPLPTYTEIFLPQLANYVKVYFPFFLLGAVFGKVMEQSGAAESIAHAITRKLSSRHTILAVVLSCALLTYGGVSLFVVAFVVYPFGASLFREANIPKRLLPPTIALGAFTFTMDALPGTPQIQNSIPMKFFNTDLYAAPVFGTVGALLIFGAGMFYLEKRRKAASDAGEGYGIVDGLVVQKSKASLPSPLLAALPLVTVFVVTLVLQKLVFPHWEISDWATQPPYKMDPATLKGTMNNWALILALSAGTSLACILNYQSLGGKLAAAISAGAVGSLLAVMNTASEVGFGNVVKVLPGFRVIADALTSNQAGRNPLLSEAITINVLSGVTGSASGGLSIALDSFGKDFLAWAQRTGTSPELLHRVGAMASGGMDTLPHNGAVITLLAITGMTHRQSYRDIFVITLIKTSVVFILIGAVSLF